MIPPSPSDQPVLGVGIDTARYGHHVSFLRPDCQPAAEPMTVVESREGYRQLQQRLESLHGRHPEARLYVRIDAAGQYAANLERFLRQLPLPLEISVGEPARNKAYRQAHFPKRKADSVESLANARYAVVERPPASWEVPAAFAALREVSSQLQSQIRQSTRLTNRLHNQLSRVFPELAVVVTSITARWVLELLAKYPTPQKIARAQLRSLESIAYIPEGQAAAVQEAARSSVASFQGDVAEQLLRGLVAQLQQSQMAEKALEKLLEKTFQALPEGGHRQVLTIPGIGVGTAAALVAKIVSIDRFATAEQLVSYFGIFPEENTSGVDKHGKPIPPGTMCMSKKGNDLVRRYLYMAAMTAARDNAGVRAVYARQAARGKRGDVALGHCMRKLLQQVFAVWVSNRAYDGDAYPHRKAQQQAEASDLAKVQSKAAGRNKGQSPKSQAVTAAAASVEQDQVSVKQPTTNPPGHDASSAQAPGLVDFAAIRRQVTMKQVLDHLGYLGRLVGSGAQRRGPCPLHADENPRSRSFSVNLDKNVCQCFHPPCGLKGNVLDLWARYHRLPLREAALNLVETLSLETPEQRRGTRKRNP
jgi:transposase